MDAFSTSYIPLLMLLAGGALGLAFAWFLLRARSVAREAHEALRREYAALEATLAAHTQANAEMRGEFTQLSAKLEAASTEAAALEAEKRLLLERLSAQESQLKIQFENLANSILEKNSAKFQEQSSKNMAEMLAPIRERFGEFQKKIDESFGAQAKEQFSLKEEIKRIVDTNEKMRLQTDSLTRALKGDTKAQGNWGEVILERILEESGLRKNLHYTLQGEEMGLRHAESGFHQRPDVIVHLPDGKHLIIDSKVSLTHYERYMSEANEALRPAHIKAFLDGLRRQVKELEERRYQESEKLGTPDFVLMFMPIEGAYLFALQHDPELHPYAWNKKVVVVCPSTLFATLRTVESVWKIETQNRNTLKIVEAGGKLYDKIVGFVDDMQKLGSQLDSASRTYHGALNKLSTGNGNMLRQAEQLKDLGAKAQKSLPRELLENASEPLVEDAA